MWLIDTGNIIFSLEPRWYKWAFYHSCVMRRSYLFYGRLIIIFSLLSTFQHALCRYRLSNPHDQRHYTSIFQQRLDYLTMPTLGLETCFCKLTEFSLVSLDQSYAGRSVGIKPVLSTSLSSRAPVSSRGTDRAASETPEVTI
jgi:hypothetical protein